MKTRLINGLTELTAENGKWITNGEVAVKTAFPVTDVSKWHDADTDIVPIADYDAQVDALIRERYSLSNELAILRQREEKPAEFEAYNAYCEECKTRVKNNIK